MSSINDETHRIRIIGDIIECDREPVAKIIIGTSTLRDRFEEVLNHDPFRQRLEEAYQRGYDAGHDAGYEDGYSEGKDDADN